MRNKLSFFIGLIVFVSLLLYAITYTVRFDETAVVTFLEEPGDNALKNKAGLYWKAPWPLSKVKSYSRKIQILEPDQQQYQTADSKAVIASLYVTWRIEDPFTFFKTVRDIETARTRLTELTDNLYANLSEYAFDELVNPDPTKIRLDAFEDQATQALRQSVETQYGIAIEKVGVRRLALPEPVTENVFASMRTTREALAANAQQEGAARANQITSQAESVRNRILAFANSTATAIRAEGQREVAEQFELFNEEPELAIFLRKIDALKKILPYRTTFILDASDINLLDQLNDNP